MNASWTLTRRRFLVTYLTSSDFRSTTGQDLETTLPASVKPPASKTVERWKDYLRQQGVERVR